MQNADRRTRARRDRRRRRRAAGIRRRLGRRHGGEGEQKDHFARCGRTEPNRYLRIGPVRFIQIGGGAAGSASPLVPVTASRAITTPLQERRVDRMLTRRA